LIERFESFPSSRPNAGVRQLAGPSGEVWGAESGNDRLVRIRVGSGPGRRRATHNRLAAWPHRLSDASMASGKYWHERHRPGVAGTG